MDYGGRKQATVRGFLEFARVYSTSPHSPSPGWKGGGGGASEAFLYLVRFRGGDWSVTLSLLFLLVGPCPMLLPLLLLPLFSCGEAELTALRSSDIGYHVYYSEGYMKNPFSMFPFPLSENGSFFLSRLLYYSLWRRFVSVEMFFPFTFLFSRSWAGMGIEGF